MSTSFRPQGLSRVVAVVAARLHIDEKKILIATAVTAIVIGASSMFAQQIRDIYQIVSIQLFPSAELAYAYGQEHFDTELGGAYNLQLAHDFFRTAARLDPEYPYVNHQLARIEFLEGDFETAILYINRQIQLYGESTPNSYYVRGLIEGYMDKFADAARDYRIYVAHDPTNWAGTNDLAWVLLKDNRPQEALDAIEKVLPVWPENPWLLNSKATALYELGRIQEAHAAAEIASRTVLAVDGKEWSKAYPGNDPLIGEEGAAAFRSAVLKNMHTISLALEKRANGVR